MIFENKIFDLDLNILFMIRADFVAATVLIAYGAVIGKLNMA